MTRLYNLLLLAVFVCIHISDLRAQTITDSVFLYLPAQTSGSEGQIVDIPIKTRFFKNLTLAQFALQWDSSVVRFVEVNNFAISGMSFSGHFGYLPTAPDKLRFAWFDNNLNAYTLADNTTLFNLRLKLVGKKGEKTPIAFFSDDLTFFEFQNKEAKEAKFGLSNGTILISNAITTQEKHQKSISISNPSPNPFQEEAVVKIELSEQQTIQLEVFDLTGKKIFANKVDYEVGTHFVNINKNNNINQIGIYFYRLSSTNNGLIKSGKLIKH